ncbi:MFS transporter, partial [Candidatus Calescamantes bacterium]|nr:MFS transporter [Candidatus Calescamantes bacterium]
IESSVLKKIIFAGFIINFGVFISHSFFMPLFFLKKFSVSPFLVGILLALHRISLGIPLLITGKLIKKYHKKIFLYAVVFQGITISLTVFMPTFFLACIMFLLHDILGASFWQPIYNSYIQKFSRETKRGKDTSVVFAYTSIGKIFAPLFAGFLATLNINYPFFFSGLITIFAFIPILTLPDLK